MAFNWSEPGFSGLNDYQDCMRSHYFWHMLLGDIPPPEGVQEEGRSGKVEECKSVKVADARRHNPATIWESLLGTFPL